jgi:hypothetical protein
MKSVAITVLALAVGVAQTANATDASLAFISCPTVRDTSSVPCWLAEFEGKLYYLGIQTDVSADFIPPSLGHKVLVEGTVSGDREICGGKVLEPVVISVLPELAPECHTMLMAEDRYELPFAAPRPPGPSTGRLAFTPPPPPPPPVAPFPEKTFTIAYDFDRTVNFQTPRFLSPALQYARLVNARRVEITGYRSAVQLTNDELYSEQENIAQVRANQIARLLQGAGLTEPEYVVHAENAAAVGGPELRKVTIRILPGD